MQLQPLRENLLGSVCGKWLGFKETDQRQNTKIQDLRSLYCLHEHEFTIKLQFRTTHSRIHNNDIWGRRCS